MTKHIAQIALIVMLLHSVLYTLGLEVIQGIFLKMERSLGEVSSATLLLRLTFPLFLRAVMGVIHLIQNNDHFAYTRYSLS